MNIYALQLNNEIKGIAQRKEYIESLIKQATKPDLIVLPELALCSYMGSTKIWQYADRDSLDTSRWAMNMAEKYNTYLAVGYVEEKNHEFYNSYLIANKNEVFGIIRKREGESFVFKRGQFPSIIPTPIGNIAVAICYDSRRKNFYENIKDQEVSLILFPHGAPSNPRKETEEKKTVDSFCKKYLDAFDVPVIYVNSVGKLDFMLGKTGKMMGKAGFVLGGMSAIYHKQGRSLVLAIPEVIGWSGTIETKRCKKPITFYGDDLVKGNWLFRAFVLKPDIRHGIHFYEKEKEKSINSNSQI
jgi:predicted amidohydrolase